MWQEYKLLSKLKNYSRWTEHGNTISPFHVEKIGIKRYQFVSEILLEKRFFMPLAYRWRVLERWFAPPAGTVEKAWIELECLIDRAINHNHVTMLSQGTSKIESRIWITDSGRQFIKPLKFVNAVLGQCSNLQTALFAIAGIMIGSPLIKTLLKIIYNKIHGEN